VIAQCFYDFLPYSVVGFLYIMNAAIDFNDEHSGIAEKIDHVRYSGDGMLAAKLQAREPPITQHRP